MKRLLAYLFIVLGLGLTFNVSAEAKGLILCTLSETNPSIFIKKIKKRRDGSLNDGCVNIFKSNYPELYKNIYNVLKKEKMHNKSAKTYYINKLKVLSILEEYDFDYKQTTKTFNQKTQIAKAEPSQIVKIPTGKNLCIAAKWPKNIPYPKNNLGSFKVPKNQILYVKKLKTNLQTNCVYKFYKTENEKLYNRLTGSIYTWWENKISNIDDGFGGTNQDKIYFISYNAINKIFDEFNLSIAKFEIGQENTQIAKVDPTIKPKKKVKVAKVEPKQEEFKPKKTNKQSKTKITKKIIKSDASDLKVKDISTWEKKVIAAIEKERSDPYCKLVDKKPKLNELKFKKNYCIKKSDILKLGKYKRFNTPEFLLTEMKGCKSNTCLADNAGKNVYKIFVQKTPIYHAKYPGDMIKGMAWFEILYQTKLKKLQKTLKRYDEQNYKGFWKLKKRVHEREIYSLIKLNRGRVKMRNALGFTLYDDMYEVIEGQWLLAEFLNKDKLKISKVKMTPEMFKRKELIEKYKTVLAKYKKKLDEEKDKKLN